MQITFGRLQRRQVLFTGNETVFVLVGDKPSDQERELRPVSAIKSGDIVEGCGVAMEVQT